MNFNRMQIDSIIFELFDGTAKYKRSFNYEELVQNWEDERPVPSKPEMEDAWNEIEQKKSLKHPSYYKLQNKNWVLDNSKKQDLKKAVESVYNLDAEKKAKKSKDDAFLAIDEATTEAQFLTSLFNSYKAEALANTSEKVKLSTKSMQALMEIYNSLTN